MTPTTANLVWNPAVTTKPAAVVQCRTVEDVRAALRSARTRDVALSVLGGGHDWAGRALREGGLVLDLSVMNAVSVDVDARTATVGGGATVGDLLAESGRAGLVTATSVVRAVGLAGLSGAGGYGPLNGRYGLTLDNLLAADVVLADGSSVHASPTGDAELYWAIRGGGQNFGVVTSMTFQLHHQPTVLAGMLMFPSQQARQVFAGYREVIADDRDELTAMAGFLPGPDGPMVFIAPFWSGTDLAEGEKVVDQLRRVGTPVVDQIAPMAYEQALTMFDAGLFDGNHFYLRTRWLAVPTDEAAAVLTAAARNRTSPVSVLALHHFHGAATRVGQADTAFGLREDHLLVEMIASWAPSDVDGDRHRDWARRTSAALAPLSLPGGYPNLLGPDEPERVPLAYGPNYARLMRAKRAYDPDNVFGSAVPTLVP